MNINNEINKILENKFGNKFNEFLQKKLNKLDILRKEIDSFKISICYGSDKENFIIENNYDKGWFNIMDSFESIYGTINYDSDYIYIPKSIIKKIIIDQVDKIINHIQKLFYKFNYITIDQIVFRSIF